jgi:integrase
LLNPTVKYVNRVIGRDGVERCYLRKRGEPAIRLSSPWGSDALEREVARLLDRKSTKPLPGTLSRAVRAYELDSPDFASLRPSTQREYRYLMVELDEDFGALPVSLFQGGRILQLRNLWAKRGHRAANLRLQVLKNVLRPCIIAGLIPGGDPFALVPLVRRPAEAAEPHLIWPETTVRLVIETAIAERRFGLARAVAIARYAGVRRGDLIRLTTAARQNGRLNFTSGKRKVQVDIPEDAELTCWLTTIPDAPNPSKHNEVRLVFGMRRAHYSEDGLSQELAKLIGRLHGQGRLASNRFDLHGLRHTRGVELAIAGCTDAQGAAQMGHSSPSTFARYRRQADRIRMSDDAARLVARLRDGSAEDGERRRDR